MRRKILLKTVCRQERCVPLRARLNGCQRKDYRFIKVVVIHAKF